ncbi:thiol-disulfide oxidoreductase DCC family protein, partial [Microvirga lenta]|uniref:thiol-disulfide oxidoreductase DCC family protein n=1 Tax=Microvirga lenta TaxID=2881337 RepID=UPI001CFF7E30
TPAAVLVLMATANILIDNSLGASTLGTQVLSMLLLLLFLAPAGRTLSLDAVIASRRPQNRVIRWMHWLSGEPGQDRLLLAKLAALSAYACLCLYSVTWHFHDDAWMSGLAISWVLLLPGSNPKLYWLAQDVYQWAPALYVEFTRLSLYGMMVWYILVLVGIFMGRYIRAFVIYWGLAFFLISAFVLPLSFLGYYELIFWFALFATGGALGARHTQPLAVLFDDRCNLCDRTVRTLAWLDLFQRLEFRPVRRNGELLARHGISLEQGLTDLVGIDHSGRIYQGYDLYFTLARRLILLWPAVPLLWLGQVMRIGPVVYRWIAERRTKLFGVCEFSTIPDRYVRQGPTLSVAGAPRLGSAASAVVLTLLVLEAAFLVRLPVTSTTGETPLGQWSKQIFGSSPLAFGIGKINVF